jgi:hypothetical protein
MEGAIKPVRTQLKIVGFLDWQQIRADMRAKGYSLVSRVLLEKNCKELVEQYSDEKLYRKTVIMERHRFGLGEYKYFDYPLPAFVQQVRESFYPQLALVANDWMQELGIDKRFPDHFLELQKQCREKGQTKPTPLILKYGKGGYNTLHQDLYGEIYFPIQLAFFLNEPGLDYTGGEFVMTEQVPRSQSKAIVLTPRKGDMIIFTTNFRPVKGSRGYYRAAMRHGLSEVLSGTRHTLGVIFHDAVS